MTQETSRGRPNAHNASAARPERSARRVDTRDGYLDLARHLANGLAGDPPSRHYAVAHVTIADVARAAGVSRSTLYRLWPSQLDFWHDLIDFVLRHVEDDPPPASFTEANARADRDTDVSFEAVLDAAHDALLTAALPLLRAGAVGYPRTAPMDATGDRPPHGIVAHLARHTADQLAVHRRRCIEGLTTTDLAALSIALGNGLAITGRMVSSRDLTVDSPTAVDGAAPRSLLGVLVGSVCRTLTEPDPDPDAARPPEHPTASPSGKAAGDDEAARLEHSPSGRRRRYLRIAARLVMETSTDAGYDRILGHVSLDRLARSAKVTRRTLTNMWPDQAQFRLDLFAHLLDRERQSVEGAISSHAGRDGTPIDSQDAFTAVGDRIHADLSARADEVSFLAYAPALDQRELSERAVHEHDRHLDRCERRLRALLVAVDRRPVRGIAFRHLALGLFTLADGANRLIRSERELLRQSVRCGRGEHSIIGHATAAILQDLTEPLDHRARVKTISSYLS